MLRERRIFRQRIGNLPTSGEIALGSVRRWLLLFTGFVVIFILVGWSAAKAGARPRGGCGSVEDEETVRISGTAHGLTDVGCLVVQDWRPVEACKSKAQ
jgi:hypothetical protein